MKQFILYPVSAKTDEEKEENSNYIYVCTKLEGADEMAKLFFDKVYQLIVKEQEEEALLLAQDETEAKQKKMGLMLKRSIS